MIKEANAATWSSAKGQQLGMFTALRNTILFTGLFSHKDEIY